MFCMYSTYSIMCCMYLTSVYRASRRNRRRCKHCLTLKSCPPRMQQCRKKTVYTNNFMHSLEIRPKANSPPDSVLINFLYIRSKPTPHLIRSRWDELRMREEEEVREGCPKVRAIDVGLSGTLRVKNVLQKTTKTTAFQRMPSMLVLE